jgi:uncharacterized protein YegP (UPF0339 family)
VQAGRRDTGAPISASRHCMGAKFGVYEDRSSGFRFRLKAGNGEVVATGENYTTRSGAHDDCQAVQRAAEAATIEDV